MWARAGVRPPTRGCAAGRAPRRDRRHHLRPAMTPVGGLSAARLRRRRGRRAESREPWLRLGTTARSAGRPRTMAGRPERALLRTRGDEPEAAIGRLKAWEPAPRTRG